MRILIFSWRDPKHPLAGGAEQVVHEHAKGWVAAGHQVTLFSSWFPNATSHESLDGISIIRRGNQYFGVHIAGILFYLRAKDKFDLIIDQFHGIPFFTPLYVRTKKLAIIHEVTKEVWLSNQLPQPLSFLVGRIGYCLEPFLFKFYKKTKFITASKSAMQDLLSFGIPKKNISVIYNGLILDSNFLMFNYREKSSRSIIFLGALTKDKGIEDAIRAFSILHSYDKNLKFWVVGRSAPKYLNFLIKIAEKLDISSSIRFFGFVSQRKKFALLSQAYVLINPSIREGWGLVNIEANSVGTPVVAYCSPGLIDSVRNGQSGVICKKNTPLELAKIITGLLTNKQKYNRLIKSSYLWGRNFSWERSRRLSLQLIERVYNEK